MSRVFSWEDIKARRIPSKDDFASVDREIRRCLAEDPTVLAATFMGSHAFGRTTVRSDLDLLAVIKRNDLEHFAILSEDLRRMAKTHNVPIDFLHGVLDADGTTPLLFPVMDPSAFNVPGTTGACIKGVFPFSLETPTPARSFQHHRHIALQDAVFGEEAPGSPAENVKRGFRDVAWGTRLLLNVCGRSWRAATPLEIGELFSEVAPRELAAYATLVAEAEEHLTEETLHQQNQPNKRRYLITLKKLEKLLMWSTTFYVLACGEAEAMLQP